MISLMMEAADISETSTHFYQPTRRYNPEVNHLPTRRRENHKYSSPDLFKLQCIVIVVNMQYHLLCFVGYLLLFLVAVGV
jgi:hypothetical protein